MQACLLGLAWLARMECLTLSHPVVHHRGTQLQVLSPGVSRYLSAVCVAQILRVETGNKNAVKLFDL